MNNKRGVALLLALFTLLIISLLVVAFLEVTTSDLQIVSNHLNRNKALYIAEAGVEYAVSRLKTSKSDFTVNNVQLPAGSGDSYSVTYTSASGKITSKGSLALGGSITLEAKASATGSSPYNVKIIYYSELY